MARRIFCIRVGKRKRETERIVELEDGEFGK